MGRPYNWSCGSIAWSKIANCVARGPVAGGQWPETRECENIMMRKKSRRNALGFFAEEFDVGWAFLDWQALAALDLFADLLDDVGAG